jgi:hypothetical protein
MSLQRTSSPQQSEQMSPVWNGQETMSSASKACSQIRQVPAAVPGVGAAGKVEAPTGQKRDGRGCDEGDAEGEEAGEGRGGGPEETDMGREREDAAERGGAGTHGVDVVEMSAAELDAPRAEAERLVDHQIRGDRRDPGGGDMAVEGERAFERSEDAELHQHQRDGDVEHQPHHAAGVAVGEPREEVRPGDRARIGVRHVDLELREDDEGRRQQEREFGPTIRS